MATYPSTNKTGGWEQFALKSPPIPGLFGVAPIRSCIGTVFEAVNP